MRTACLHLIITLICAVLAPAQVAPVNYAPGLSADLLPDGTAFEFWSDRTQYSKTWHVNRNHPAASDENPGTEDRPFKTIQRAAEQVRPGERVIIHAGHYREMVQPLHSGEGPDRMIAYEAAPGERVVISGSRVFEGKWERSAGVNGKGRYSKKLWSTRIDDPVFGLPNATDAEIDLMPWAVEWKGRLPYTLPRGMLFEDGRRMTQMAAYEDLVVLPGSYWVAPDRKTVHIHPFDGRNPSGHTYEAAVQPHLFKPQQPGFGYIRVSGLTFEHCANGFLRCGVGAVFTLGGHHWIIERNTVRQVNSVGIEIGHEIFENKDPRWTRRAPEIGRVVLRGNRIEHCGTAGVRGLRVSHALVEDNEITDCGWQDAEFHWEMAAIKLLLNRGTLVRNNYIGRIRSAAGIWLDWDNINSRVTGNFIFDVQSQHGAVFIEASQKPNLVDHNTFWDIDGEGVRLADTDEAIVANNLFGRIVEDLVVTRVATDRSLHGRRLTSMRNRVLNNLLVDSAKSLQLSAGNSEEGNIALTTGSSPGQPRVRVNVDERTALLHWKPEQPLPSGAGPFPGLAHETAIRLARPGTAGAN